MKLSFIRIAIGAFLASSLPLSLIAQTAAPVTIAPGGTSTYVITSNNFTDCGVTGTAKSSNTAVVTVTPGSFGSSGGPSSVTLTLTGISSGTATVTGSYVADPSCSPSSGSFTIPVTVGTVTSPPSSGQTPNVPKTSDPISLATGELSGHDEAADLSLGGTMNLEFRRYYGSYLSGSGFKSTYPSFGTNWMNNFDVTLVVSGNNATVTLFRGKTVKFTQSKSIWTLASTEQQPYQLAALANGDLAFFDPMANLIYQFQPLAVGPNITLYVLSLIGNRNGNSLSLTTSGLNTVISDSHGRTLTESFNNALQLISVADQSGRTVSFTYTTSGLLSGVTDANGHTETYSYTSSGGLSGLMTTDVRPAGNTPFTQTFDSAGRVAKQTDSFANALALTYSAAGATLQEAAGTTLTQVFDSNFNITSGGDATGTSKYAYDADNRPTQTTDRLGNKTSATWDAASGHPASFTDELGNRTTFTSVASSFFPVGDPRAAAYPFTTFDLTGVQYADGTKIAITRDASGNVTSTTDQAGKSWQATYTTPLGLLATLTNPSGGVFTLTYNDDLTRASVTDPFSNTTTFGYDSAKRLNLITNPDGSSKSFTYDAVGNLLKATDERKNSVSKTLDANNNVKTTVDALGATTNVSFDQDDRRTTTQDPLGHTTTSSYDSQSRLKLVSNGAGNSIDWAYDNLNRVTAVADASNNGFTFGLDAEGRRTSVTDALSRVTGFARDAHGNITAITTPNNEKFAYAFDSQNRLTSAIDPLNRRMQYSRDRRGIVSAVFLPGGAAATYVLNELGLPTTVTDATSNAWTRAYDNAGRLTSSTDPLGRATNYTYDKNQRISQIADPTATAQYGYDVAGNLTGLSYTGGSPNLTFTWDANSRLTAATGLSLSYDATGHVSASNGLTITRDAANRIASVTYASGKAVNYAYNNRGFLSTVTDWVGGATTFTYDNAGQLSGETFANGVAQAFTWDKDSRLLTETVSGSGKTVASLTLTRDALGRVTSATRSAANIPSEALGTLSPAYDAASQVINGSFNGYDGAGRVVRDAIGGYGWDGDSRLSYYARSDGGTLFTYDALGQSISRSDNGVAQNYVWNYAFPLPVLSVVRSSVAADLTYYVWLPDGTLLESISAADNSRRFYSFDESGSTILLTDSSGAVTDTYAISAFGDVATQTGSTANPFTWQGKYGAMRQGSTSLYYMRARYYDSATERFLSRDPESSGDPRAVNRYQFVYGNPIGHSDPSGKDTVNVNGQLLDFNDPTNIPLRHGPLPFSPSSVARAWVDDPALAVDKVPLENESGWGRQDVPTVTSSSPVGTFPLINAISSGLPGGSCFTTCSTSLLFPFVTNQLGFDTGLAIANTTSDLLNGRCAQSGTCSLTFFGPSVPIPANTPTSPDPFSFGPQSTGPPALINHVGFAGANTANSDFEYDSFSLITALNKCTATSTCP